MAQLGRSCGLVVALDDVHWADPASLELLDHLVRHPVPGPVVLVVARRDRQTPTALTASLTRGADTEAVLRIGLAPLAERNASKDSPPICRPTGPRDCTPQERATRSTSSLSSTRTARTPLVAVQPPRSPPRSAPATCPVAWRRCC